MENNILNLEANKAMTAHEFKSAEIRDRVSELTARYAAFQSTAKNIGEEIDALRNETYKELAPIVAKLSEMNAHKAEGFKTWPQFVEACLPINSRAAGTLITYYKKVQVVPELAEFTVSNVEAIAPADAVAIKKAIESKEITPETTQPKLREFAKAHPRAESGKGRPKVEPEFILTNVKTGETIARVIKADFASACGASEIVYLPAPKDGSPRRFIAYNANGDCVMMSFAPYIKPKSEKPAPKKDISVYDQLRAQFDFMADWTDEQIAATLRKNADKAKGK